MDSFRKEVFLYSRETRKQILEGWLAASAALPTAAHLSGQPPVISFWGGLPRCPLPPLSRTVRPPPCPVNNLFGNACTQPGQSGTQVLSCRSLTVQFHQGVLNTEINRACLPWAGRAKIKQACLPWESRARIKHGSHERGESPEITHACRGPQEKSRVTHPLYSVQTLPHGRYYNITYAMKVKIETQECMLVIKS